MIILTNDDSSNNPTSEIPLCLPLPYLVIIFMHLLTVTTVLAGKRTRFVYPLLIPGKSCWIFNYSFVLLVTTATTTCNYVDD